jgi:glycosyltransferase involved in cell wall biosynthesis
VNAPAPLRDVGAVVIGRNEGAALHACLNSVVPRVTAVVYVDSGSTDDSVAFARGLGVEVVDLDTSVPFTAARARDAGLKRLLEVKPGIAFVQFVDGDCEVDADWLATAHQELAADEKLAVVCGRRRERHPDDSIYNRHCDMEWDTPVGKAKSCGGDAMMRIKAYQKAGGFNTSMICGEEPELCIRIRAGGWTVRRLDAEMTLHDAKMTRLGQFWKRSVRGGWAYAEGAAMHGKPPERHCVRQCMNTWVYGVILPIVLLGVAWWTYGISLLLMLLIYGRHVWSVRRDRLRNGDEAGHALTYAWLATVAKLPEAVGQIMYWLTRLRGKQATLIEYKPQGTTARTGDA